MLKLTRAQFNVGVEQFISNWWNTEIILSVRDIRMYELDPFGRGCLVAPRDIQAKVPNQRVFPIYRWYW